MLFDIPSTLIDNESNGIKQIYIINCLQILNLFFSELGFKGTQDDCEIQSIALRNIILIIDGTTSLYCAKKTYFSFDYPLQHLYCYLFIYLFIRFGPYCPGQVGDSANIVYKVITYLLHAFSLIICSIELLSIEQRWVYPFSLGWSGMVERKASRCFLKVRILHYTNIG